MKNINLKIIIAVLILASCNKKIEETVSVENSNIVELTANQAKNVSLATCKISAAQLSIISKVNGMVDVPPQNLVSVSSYSGGYLTETKLLPGMRVTKGEVIARITDPQFIQLQQDYLTIKSKIYFAGLENKRQKILAENEATSDKSLQLTNAELQQNKILLAAIATKLQLLNINPFKISTTNIQKTIALYAPISGFVKNVNVNIGMYLTPSQVLFEIINPTDIHLNLKVFEQVAQSLKIGQKVITYSNTDVSKKYDCEILLVNKAVNPNGLVEIHCHFNNYHPSLIVGMYMNAEIETQSSLQNALPTECITNFEGKNYLFTVIKPNKYEMIEVKTGIEENNFVEIKNASFLKNKTIVSKGAYTLLMALKNTKTD